MIFLLYFYLKPGIQINKGKLIPGTEKLLLFVEFGHLNFDAKIPPQAKAFYVISNNYNKRNELIDSAEKSNKYTMNCILYVC